MDRRRFLLTSLAGALAAPLGAESQPTLARELVLLGGERGLTVPPSLLLRADQVIE